MLRNILVQGFQEYDLSIQSKKTSKEVVKRSSLWRFR